MSTTTTIPRSIRDIRERNRRSGRHFFDADTLRFFRSRILPTVHVGTTRAFFVTSEQYDDDAPRRYTVRFCDPDGDCGTIDTFQGHPTARAAQDAARAAAAQD
jgi:hypothetical protein